MYKNRRVLFTNETVIPNQQSKVYLGNKVRAKHSNQNGGSYKKTKYTGEGCGCGSNKNPKQIRKRVK